MIKETIVVPAGIRYISDWAKHEGGYRLEDYSYPHIVNKQITGCGFTEYCLTNDLDVILCSPRKILLENKEDQHHGEVLYVNNFLGVNSESNESYDTDLNKKQVEKTEEQLTLLGYTKEAAEKPAIKLSKMKEAIRDYLTSRRSENKPCKILVTYDSFRHVKEVLKSLQELDKFFVVIDEFQSIFVDSRFKSTTELEFSSQLNDVQKRCYVSATPMLDKYLFALDEFSNLPYYEFDWGSLDSSRAIVPKLTIKSTKSITSEAGKVIMEYRMGKFKTIPVVEGPGKIHEIESKEAVLYFNSVKHICGLIKKFELKPEECNILCAKSPENEERVRKAFGVKKKDFSLGHVPKKGEPHKMFTFCTRTVYLGADFYSTNARSFIFSDANIDSLALDISLDLPQILGRQRLDENPWKNSATLFFKPIVPANEISQEVFDDYIAKKIAKTDKILKAVDSVATEDLRESLIDRLDRSSYRDKYPEDYVAINRHGGNKPIAVFNKLVMISERRAFDIQQVDYKDRFRVFATLNESADEYDVTVDVVTTALAKFDSLQNFPDKMEYLCSDEVSESVRSRMLFSIPDDFVKYYRVLGPDLIKKARYRRVDLENEYRKILNNQGSEETVKSLVYKAFQVGEKYLPSLIKAELKQIYASCEYIANAKATDLNKYFSIRENKLESNGVKTRAYEILAILDNAYIENKAEIKK